MWINTRKETGQAVPVLLVQHNHEPCRQMVFPVGFYNKNTLCDNCLTRTFLYRYSIILLALVDHKYRFRFVNVGAPGRCHDSHVYQVSKLAKIVGGPLFKAPEATICGAQVPPVILCDQAFPLTPNLMKPFGHSGLLSEEQKAFNYNLSKARRIVENAFGRLKARFRFTMKRMECDVENARLVIRACCILNNICEDFNDTIQHQWLTEVHQFDVAFPQPSRTTQAQVGAAAAVRSALADYYRQRN